MRAFRIFLFLLIAVGLIWLTVILIGKALSTGSSSTSTPQQSLVSYATTDAEFVMLIDGPVQSDQTHQSLRITVARDQNVIELMNGYEGQVVSQESFASNSVAFAAFLKSLDKVGFSQPVSKSVSADERGVCPFRNRFIYSITQNGTEKRRAWTTTCNTGNYAGVQSSTRLLFINQIPSQSFSATLRGQNFSTQ